MHSRCMRWWFTDRKRPHGRAASCWDYYWPYKLIKCQSIQMLLPSRCSHSHDYSQAHKLPCKLLLLSLSIIHRQRMNRQAKLTSCSRSLLVIRVVVVGIYVYMNKWNVFCKIWEYNAQVVDGSDRRSTNEKRACVSWWWCECCSSLAVRSLQNMKYS